MSDRTGELCPFCKKGKLYPSGKRDFVEPVRQPKSGEARREYTEYECDYCKRRTGAHGLGLVATMTATVEVKVSDADEKTKNDKNTKK